MLRRRRRSGARFGSLRPALEALENLTLLSATITPASIAGTVWADSNGDGTRQPGEPGLAGATVFLDLNHDHTLDGTVTTVNAPSTAIVTAPGAIGASFGGFASTLQAPGLPSSILGLTVSLDLVNNGSAPVDVAVVSPTGLAVPNLPTLFLIQPGEHFVGTFDQSSTSPVTLAHPDATGLLSGTFRPQQAFTDPAAHIFDGDPNGTWGLVFFGDPTQLVLNSWSLGFTQAEPSATTDANGNYSFSGLAPGTYSVGTVLAPGNAATSPAGAFATQTVTVGDGQTASGTDFGIQPASDLTGTAFNLAAPATAWGQDVTIQYSLANRGDGTAPAFDVAVVLSGSGVIDPAAPPLATLHFEGLAAGASKSGSVTVTLPPGSADLTRSEIGFAIDPAHALAHNVAADGSNRGPGLDFTALGTGANTAVTSGAGIQQNPSIAVDPADPKHLVVAYMDDSLPTLETGYAGIGVAVSRDGGQTWTRSTVPLPADYGGGAADPVVKFDGHGGVLVSFMAANFLGSKPGLTDPLSNERLDGFQSDNGIFVAASADGGATWGQASAVDTNNFTASGGTKVYFDAQPDLAVDTFHTLPNGQNILYATWTRFYPKGQFRNDPTATGGSDLMFAVSSDGGRTWTLRTQTDPNTGQTVSALLDPLYAEDGSSAEGKGRVTTPQVSIGPEGDIYVSNYSGNDFTVYHSTDGGATFRAPDRTQVALTGVPFQQVTPAPTLYNDQFQTPWVRDIVADPAHPGRVYVADVNQAYNYTLGTYVDAADVVFARSDDYGRTWEPFFQVGTKPTNLAQLPPGQNDAFLSALNDDNGGRFVGFDSAQQLNSEVLAGQALPSLSADAQGRLTVIWYDTRRDPAGQKLDVFGTVSTDGGMTFTRNFRVTDTSFDPNAGTFTDATGNTNYSLGRSLGVATAGGTAYTVWTDTRNGGQRIEFQPVPIAPAPQGPIDRFSPNFTAATATDLGQVAVPQVVPALALGPDGGEWFRLSTAASGTLIVSASAAGSGAVVLQLTDAAGNPVAATATDVLGPTGAVVGEQLAYPSAAGAVYLVHVAGASADPVGYSLVVGSLTGDFGSAVQGTSTASLSAGGAALYRLQAGVAGSLVVTLGPGADASGSLGLAVLAADGQTVLASGQTAVTLPVTQGEVVLLQVTGADPTVSGSFTVGFTNLDQFETPVRQTLFFPTPGGPSAIAAADLTGVGNTDLVVSATSGTDAVTVLAGNGDGTFQAPRQYGVGPGLTSANLDAGYREIGVANLTGGTTPDLIVPNFRAGDVSVLLGNGDGSFQPERRFDGAISPESLVTGHFAPGGQVGVAVLQNSPQFGGTSQFAVLYGRGDGTFSPSLRLSNGTYSPSIKYSTAFGGGAFPIRAGNFSGRTDGLDDLAVFSGNDPHGQLWINNGDGSFRDGGLFSVGENVNNALAADLGGRLALITAGTNSGDVWVTFSNGDGTFQAAQPYLAMKPNPGDNVQVFGLALVNVGGVPNLYVTAAPRLGSGPAELILLPGQLDASGHFTGFGAPRVLTNLAQPGLIAAGDFAHNGATDVAVTEPGGVLVYYGTPPTFATNNTPATARDFGGPEHLVTQPAALVNGFEDAYFTYHVPLESAGGGDQVIDFSATFQDTGGLGLQMEVSDAQGTVLGSGARFRVRAAQGDVLTVHVFGLSGESATAGYGVYTLDIDVLPQVVSVQAQSVLPGGPSTSLVVTLQGDNLDPAAASDPANYTVIWFGPEASAGTVFVPPPIAIAAPGGGAAVVYNPRADIQAASGLHYASASQQTVTLLFAQALPPGSYEVRLSPKIQAAPYNADESRLVAPDDSFAGHPVVSSKQGTTAIKNGADVIVANLVAPSGTPGDLSALGRGTPFLSQLTDDLSALLDQLLAAKGDDPSITAAVDQEAVSRLAPTAAAGGPTFTIFWFDPVSLDLQTGGGQGVSYSLASNAVSNSAAQTFVQVGGNVELVVMANAAGSFNLDVANVPSSARGGEVQVAAGGSSSTELTGALRGGEESFSFNTSESSGPEATTSGPEGTGGSVASATGSSGGLSVASNSGPSGAGAVIGAGVSTNGATEGSTSTESSESGAGATTGSATTVAMSLPSTSRRSFGGGDMEVRPEDLEASNYGPLVRSALDAVLNVVSKVSGVANALGLSPRAPVVLIWRGVMNALKRTAAPAPPANGVKAPLKEVAPSAVLDAIDRALHDEQFRGMPPETDLAALAGAADEPQGTDAYLAAAFVAAGVDLARSRIKVKIRSRRAREKESRNPAPDRSNRDLG